MSGNLINLGRWRKQEMRGAAAGGKAGAREWMRPDLEEFAQGSDQSTCGEFFRVLRLHSKHGHDPPVMMTCRTEAMRAVRASMSYLIHLLPRLLAYGAWEPAEAALL